MSDLKTRLGVKVRQLRNRHGLSQGKLAEAAGTTVTTISSIERGETATNLDLLESIAHQLGTSAAELLAEPGASQDTLREVLILLTTLDQAELNATLAFLHGLRNMDPPDELSSEPGEAG